MSLLAVGVLLVAALFHALWNGLLRHARDRYIAMWWATLVGAVVSIPLLWVAPPMPAYGWGFVLVSSVLESFYFLLLVSAYKHGDFSVVYPIARGTAPGLLAIWAALFLGERPTPLAAVGIGVLVGGLVIIGWQAGRGKAQSAPSYHSVMLALAVAVTISLYSLVDGAAVQTLDVLGYSARVSLGMALLLTPPILWRYGVPALREEWHASAPRLITTGVLATVAYLLVLGVYQVAPISYAGAIREVSVVFGALLGKLWFKEPVGLERALGVLCIFGGAMLITTG